MEKMNPEYRYLLATICHEQGSLEDAVTSLKQTVYLDSAFVMAYYLLGHITRDQGRPGEAKKYFTNARDLLKSMEPGEIVPHSEGLTAERLREAIGLNA